MLEPVDGAASCSGSDEAELVRRLRAGDEEAYERVVRTYAGRLLATARRLLRREEDARDAVQEGFLAAYKSIESFHGSSSLSTWLHRIVVNAALMKLRSARRRPEESIEALLPQFQEDGHQIFANDEWSLPADAVLLRMETRQLVRASIDQLPASYRTILLLRDIEELDTEEVARVLEITPNAVKIRVHRARQALRTLLNGSLGKRPSASAASSPA